MAMGVPVVASSVAAAGVDAEPDAHLRVASSVDDYVSQMLEVLGSPGERRRLAQAGRARMLSHHSWPASMRLDDIGARCAANAGRRRDAA
jgi:glycosyltransferase involved in cell wall biosynthesis